MGSMRSFRLMIPIAVLASAACTDPSDANGHQPPPQPDGGSDGGFAAPAPDPVDVFLTALPQGAAQTSAVCARGHMDAVALALCANPAPPIAGISDLEQAVGLLGSTPPGFALLAHSEALPGRLTSAINPRAIVFTVSSGQPTETPNDGTQVLDPGFVALSFVRGEQIVELAAQDPSAGGIHFYFFKFRQECNKFGCTPGDLYTPAIESGWTGWTLYEDSDLTNTVFDCQHCHQPGGASATKILRMQERRAPWTHWMRNNQNEPGGVALLADFQNAHGGSEAYAGIPGSLFATPRTDPLLLEALVENNSLSPQPNEFVGATIELEVQQSAPMQPNVNVPPGTSATWDSIFENAVSGLAIATPYHDVKVTDPGKLATLTADYVAVMNGSAPPSSLPDLRDVFLDQGLPQMGFQPSSGASGAQILTQMCQSCHDGSADPSLTRSRFDVTQLATMSQAEKALAVQRLMEPTGSTKIMPPALVGELSASEIALASAALQ